MFYQAKEGQVILHETTMDYVEFGCGKKILVIIPGLGDGLKTVKGQAKFLALYYRELAKKFKVYIFSRKNILEKGCTTKDMAEDLHAALADLKIERCAVAGISQGGMIAQHMAILYPEMVERLLIAVSAARKNEVICERVSKWISLAEKKDYKALMIDTCENTYGKRTLKWYRLCYPFIGLNGKNKDYSRFLIQAGACLTHNAYEEAKDFNKRMIDFFG